MSIKTELQSNNTDLQNLIDQANALPDPGVQLPELSNEGTASDLRTGKELIDSEGNVVTGTFEPSGTNLWAKFDSTGENLQTLLVSTDADAYPDGFGDDGYYYQKIVYIVGADDTGTYLLEV